MLAYATVGARDLKAAKQFYDQVLDLVGMKTMFEHPSGGRIYNSPDGRLFGVLAPADGREATVGNGTMIGFLLGSRELMGLDESVDIEVYSPQSPLGAAILGHKVGETVTYRAPAGHLIEVTVVEVKPFTA